MLTACQDCGRRFRREIGESWRVRCFPCWKATKGQTARHTESERRYWFDLGFEAGISQAPKKAGFEPDKIRQLLQLVHPDKHNGSPLSQRVTAWLLDLRQEVTR